MDGFALTGFIFRTKGVEYLTIVSSGHTATSGTSVALLLSKFELAPVAHDNRTEHLIDKAFD
jgi:hypothetical protein